MISGDQFNLGRRSSGHRISLSCALPGPSPWYRITRRSHECQFRIINSLCWRRTRLIGDAVPLTVLALYNYNDLMLSEEFQPMAAQLSMKAVLPLAKILAIPSCRSCNTGLWSTWNNTQELTIIWMKYSSGSVGCHDDVIKWRHFPRYWSFVRGIHRSTVNSPHKGQWRGALMFSLMCARINSWVNNLEAGDLRRYRRHYDVIVMICAI